MRNILRNFVRFFYNKFRYTRFAEAIEEEFEIQSYSGVTERHFEYPFGIAEVLARKKHIKTILDAGSFGSPFGLILAAIGFKITGADIVSWKIEFPGFKQVVADLKKLPYKNNSFDAVTAISTVEHCGLPRFGEGEDENGDVKAVSELYRVLKKSGFCILTTPYAGKSVVVQNKHRIYDKKRFKKMIGKFKVIKKKFYAPVHDQNTFVPCTEREIEQLDPTIKHWNRGVICTVLKK